MSRKFRAQGFFWKCLGWRNGKGDVAPSISPDSFLIDPGVTEGLGYELLLYISEAAQRSQDVFRRLCRYLPVAAGPVVFKPESVNADWLQ